MKRHITRLVVAAETIRRLDVPELRGVAGGAIDPSKEPQCWPDIPPRFGNLGPTKYAQHCITASCPDQT